jgi:hypothetical protein
MRIDTLEYDAREKAVLEDVVLLVPCKRVLNPLLSDIDSSLFRYIENGDEGAILLLGKWYVLELYSEHPIDNCSGNAKERGSRVFMT